MLLCSQHGTVLCFIRQLSTQQQSRVTGLLFRAKSTPIVLRAVFWWLFFLTKAFLISGAAHQAHRYEHIIKPWVSFSTYYRNLSQLQGLKKRIWTLDIFFVCYAWWFPLKSQTSDWNLWNSINKLQPVHLKIKHLKINYYRKLFGLGLWLSLGRLCKSLSQEQVAGNGP